QGERLAVGDASGQTRAIWPADQAEGPRSEERRAGLQRLDGGNLPGLARVGDGAGTARALNGQANLAILQRTDPARSGHRVLGRATFGDRVVPGVQGECLAVGNASGQSGPSWPADQAEGP